MNVTIFGLFYKYPSSGIWICIWCLAGFWVPVPYAGLPCSAHLYNTGKALYRVTNFYWLYLRPVPQEENSSGIKDMGTVHGQVKSSAIKQRVADVVLNRYLSNSHANICVPNNRSILISTLIRNFAMEIGWRWKNRTLRMEKRLWNVTSRCDKDLYTTQQWPVTQDLLKNKSFNRKSKGAI